MDSAAPTRRPASRTAAPRAATSEVARPSSADRGAPAGAGAGAPEFSRGGTSGGAAPSAGGSGGAPAPAASPAPATPAAPADAGAAPASAAPTPAGDAGGSAPAAPTSAAPADSGGSIELLMPEPEPGLDAEAQAALDAANLGNETAAQLTTDVPPAEQSTADARGAVVEPEAQLTAQAGGALVASFDDRAPPSPEIEAFCERVREIIRSKRPVDEESLTQANPDEAAAEAGSQVQTNVQSGVDGAQQSYDGMQDAPPAGAPAPSTPATPTPEGVDTPAVDAAGAAPNPLPEENTDLSADVDNADQQMEDAGMNTEPAQLVDSGPIADARGARGELSETATAEREAMLARQQEAITTARTDMATLQERARETLALARQQQATGSNSQQDLMVGSEEQIRANVGAEANRIFTEAQTQVRDLLQPLAQNAQARWDAEIVVIKRTFRSDLDAVQRAIDERHSGIGGAILSAWDWATGLPDWVTRDYDRAETNFTDSVCNLIRDISRDVNTVIRDAEALIESARKRIDELFANLPEGLRGWAQEQQAGFAERIASLHTEVLTARQNIEQGLTQRAGEAVDEVRREVAALRDAARGALGRLADALAAFLEDPVRAIINGLLSLVGISPPAFWALIDRIGEVIDAIADDPMGFASNLVSALGRGFTQFFDNFGTHVLNGLVQWLFSGLGSVGVQIPSDFSLRSVITFFLQLMGISWDRIRRLLARHIGEQNVALIERAWQLVSTLIERGPEGIFEMIQEQLNPENILSMVLDAAKDFLIERLIRAVAVRILGMLNPAGAILQAIELIYRVVSWVFNNAASIFALVETVVNGAADLVAGNIGGMANAVEGALARLIPPVIDFLAGLLGFGDLPDKIADVIRGFQARVERVLDRVIGFLATQARRLLSAVGLGGREQPQQGEHGDGEIGETVRFSAGGEAHRLWVDTSGTRATVKMASQERTLAEHLTDFHNRAADKPNAEEIRGWVAQARTQATSIETLGAQAKTQTIDSPERNRTDEQIEAAERALRPLMAAILNHLGVTIPERVEPVVRATFSADPAVIRTAFGRGEYRRQIRLQQDQINNMVVADWMRNRSRFAERRTLIGTGRHPGSNNAQQAERDNVRSLLVFRLTQPHSARGARAVDENIYFLNFVNRTFMAGTQVERDNGFSLAEAERRVNGWMGWQHALHSPDQVAGGEHDELTGVGVGAVNSDIGANWGAFGKPRHLANDVEAETRANLRTANVDEAFWRQVRMNVQLGL